MAKTTKKTERDLVERLRRMGLRKQLAKNVAHTATNVKGQLPDSARNAITEMIAKVDDLGAGVSRKRKHSDGGPETDSPVEVKQAKKARKKAKKKAKKKARQAAVKAKPDEKTKK